MWSNVLLDLSAQALAASAIYIPHSKDIQAALSFLHSLMQIYFIGYKWIYVPFPAPALSR